MLDLRAALPRAVRRNLSQLRVFDVKPDGTVAGGRVWAELTGEGAGAPDGMKLDGSGNLYCTGPGGVHVLDAEARCWA